MTSVEKESHQKKRRTRSKYKAVSANDSPSSVSVVLPLDEPEVKPPDRGAEIESQNNVEIEPTNLGMQLDNIPQGCVACEFSQGEDDIICVPLPPMVNRITAIQNKPNSGVSLNFARYQKKAKVCRRVLRENTYQVSSRLRCLDTIANDISSLSGDAIYLLSKKRAAINFFEN